MEPHLLCVGHHSVIWLSHGRHFPCRGLCQQQCCGHSWMAQTQARPQRLQLLGHGEAGWTVSHRCSVKVEIRKHYPADILIHHLNGCGGAEMAGLTANLSTSLTSSTAPTCWCSPSRKPGQMAHNKLLLFFLLMMRCEQHAQRENTTSCRSVSSVLFCASSHLLLGRRSHKATSWMIFVAPASQPSLAVAKQAFSDSCQPTLVSRAFQNQMH